MNPCLSIPHRDTVRKACPSPMELLCAVSSSSDHHTVPQKGSQVPVKSSVFLTKGRKGLL